MRYSRHDADSMQTRLEHPNAFGNPDWRDMSVVHNVAEEKSSTFRARHCVTRPDHEIVTGPAFGHASLLINTSHD